MIYDPPHKTRSFYCLVGVTLPATPAVLSHKGTIIGSIFESKSQLLSPYKKAKNRRRAPTDRCAGVRCRLLTFDSSR